MGNKKITSTTATTEVANTQKNKEEKKKQSSLVYLWLHKITRTLYTAPMEEGEVCGGAGCWSATTLPTLLTSATAFSFKCLLRQIR